MTEVEVAPIDILLVDDERKNLTALEAILRHEDWNLIFATSGPDALKKALVHDFAVIVLDVLMPGMSGFETAELIRERDKSRETPIIFLTADDRTERATHAYTIGAVDYIVKPVNSEALRSKVSVFAELFRRERQVKRQAHELAEKTALLDGILASATDYAIAGVDVDGQIVFWSEGASQHFGFTAAEMVKKRSLSTIYSPEDIESGRVDRLFDHALTTGRAHGELDFVSRNGRRISTALTIHRRYDPRGASLGYVVVAKDITEQKRLELQQAQLVAEQHARAVAEAAVKAREEFLYIAAHELKNPLAGLSGYIQMMRRLRDQDRLSGDRLDQGLKMLDGSARRLIRLSEHLLNVARLQTGQLEFLKTPTDLDALLDELLAQYSAGLTSHRLVFDGTTGGATINGDADRLIEVIENLLNNAVKYSPEGSEIRISVEYRDGSVVVCVADDGIGIPDGLLAQIFEPFVRGSNVSEPHLPGLGLGLFLCRQIVESHGGRIEAASRGVGLGTTVSVWLPAYRDVAEVAHA